MPAREVRAILLDLAAKRLGVDADTLTVADGVIAAPDGRKVSYGELAGAADLHREATAQARPKPASAHKIVGKPVPRRDIPAKVTGGVAYVQDMRLPGMLHGRVVRPPRYGAKLEALDEARIKAMPGVVAVVRDGSFLGVIAEREEQAIKASAVATALADERAGDGRVAGSRPLPGPGTHLRSPAGACRPRTRSSARSRRRVPDGREDHRGDLSQALHGACARSGRPARSPQLSDGKMTVWTHSQGVFPLRGNLAMALKMPAENIRCIHAEGSGCYGHNGGRRRGARRRAAGAGRARSAGAGAMDARRRVRLGAVRARHGDEGEGGAVADGRIADWNYELWSNTHSTRPSEPGGNNLLASWYLAEPQRPAPPRMMPQPAGGGDRNAVPLYDFPRQRIVNHFIKDMPLRVSALRTLGAYANVFAMESFMDELALAADADPVAFRLAHLKDPRARAVIEAVAKKAGWKPGETRRRHAGPRHRLCQVQERSPPTWR